MKIKKEKIDHTFFIKIVPQLIEEETEDGTLVQSKYSWQILQRPDIISNVDDENVVAVFPKKHTGMNESLIDIHLMRSFACQLIRSLINGDGQVHQKELYTDINFQISEEDKKHAVEVISELEKKIIGEIFFQNNPIKPTKNKIESLSLLPKQSENE